MKQVIESSHAAKKCTIHGQERDSSNLRQRTQFPTTTDDPEQPYPRAACVGLLSQCLRRQFSHRTPPDVIADGKMKPSLRASAYRKPS